MRDKETLDNGFDLMFTSLLTSKLNTVLVGEVVAWDGKNNVSVQPSIMRKLKDKDPIPLPILHDVPLVYSGSGQYFVRFKIELGSFVVLLCNQRSLDLWKTSEDGAISGADSKRKFDMSDAIAIPGIVPFNMGVELTEDMGDICIVDTDTNAMVKLDGGSVVMKNDDGSIILADNGKITMNNHLTVEP